MWVGAGNSVTVAQWLSENAAISSHFNVDRSYFLETFLVGSAIDILKHAPDKYR